VLRCKSATNRWRRAGHRALKESVFAFTACRSIVLPRTNRDWCRCLLMLTRWRQLNCAFGALLAVYKPIAPQIESFANHGEMLPYASPSISSRASRSARITYSRLCKLSWFYDPRIPRLTSESLKYLWYVLCITCSHKVTKPKEPRRTLLIYRVIIRVFSALPFLDAIKGNTMCARNFIIPCTVSPFACNVAPSFVLESVLGYLNACKNLSRLSW